jgi:hypothetical protein
MNLFRKEGGNCMEPTDKSPAATPSHSVDDLLGFVNANASTATQINLAIAEIGRRQVRVVAIKLLKWMKSQHRIGKLWPLELEEKHECCRNLLHLIQSQAFAADVIYTKDTTIVFRPELNENEVNAMLAVVDAGFQPPLMRMPSGRTA